MPITQTKQGSPSRQVRDLQLGRSRTSAGTPACERLAQLHDVRLTTGLGRKAVDPLCPTSSSTRPASLRATFSLHGEQTQLLVEQTTIVCPRPSVAVPCDSRPSKLGAVGEALLLVLGSERFHVAGSRSTATARVVRIWATTNSARLGSQFETSSNRTTP